MKKISNLSMVIPCFRENFMLWSEYLSLALKCQIALAHSKICLTLKVLKVFPNKQNW